MSKVTLQEAMGKSADKAKQGSLSLDDLPDLLGERMPKLEYTRLGRLRLMRKMRDRFGPGFKSLPGMDGVMKQFDQEMGNNEDLHKAKMLIGGILG